MRFDKYKFLAGVITILIITILVVSGPAKAVTIGFSVLDNSINLGEKIYFEISVKAESSENLVTDYLVLKMSGPSEIACKFNKQGQAIEGCNGISIEKIKENYSENYGYGVSDIELGYKIELESSEYLPGEYLTELVLYTNNGEFSKQGDRIIILEENLKSCSIRAENGNLAVENISFSKGNKLNFYIPLKNAVNGEGYITAQKDRERFSYNFDIGRIVKNNEYELVIEVSGKYRIGLKDYVNENAVIMLNKKSKTINIVGWENLNINEMKVTFMDGC